MNTADQRAALADRIARDPTYTPRTRHLDAAGHPRYTNALIHAASPYLLQHAHNPVDWRPWGPEAFAEARARAVPIFLSVGYSTCHWCHVMEHESFEDEEIAAALNAGFVPVKVDREARPDVDAVYMAFLQRTTGGGGWPMSVWLTPEGRPLFAGTYFPARDGDRGPHRGFLSLLRIIGRNWRDPGFQAQADEVIAALTAPDRAASAALPAPEALAGGAAIFAKLFDPEWGGFGRAPKFPRPAVLEMLLRAGRRAGDPRPSAQVATTLTRMHCGGMYDHVGGGFARYSVDRFWRVPHFEKMLYDNAQLAVAYLEGWQALVSGDPDHPFAHVVDDVLAYLDREMSDPAGGFYSATDADSTDEAGQMHEGHYFVWTPADIDAALPPADARWVRETFGVEPGGHFEGRSVLHLAEPLSTAERARWSGIREALRATRAKRAAPGLDDKVLTAWNALTASAFARAGVALARPDWIARAGRCAGFLLDNLRDGDRLHRTWRRGEARHPAVLEDYATLIIACLDLLEATGAVRWLDAALALQATLDQRFADPAGGYFRTADDAADPPLLFREKPDYDGAEPGGNSQAALGLLRLAELTGDAEHRRRAEGTLRALGRLMSEAPHAVPKALCALDRAHGDTRAVIIVTPPGADPAEATAELWREARCLFAPNTVRLFGPADGPLAKRIPLFAQRVARGGAATAYVCVGTTCDQPTTDPTALAGQLG